MTPIIPTILTTERLILRRPVEGDRAAYVAFYTSDRSAMALGPKSPEGANAFFDQECALWDDKGFGMYTLFTKADPTTPAGLIGLWQPDGWAEPELGWLLWEQAEGKGYATEAARACAEMWQDLGHRAPISYIEDGNDASKTVARKLGAAVEGAHPNDPTTEAWRHETLPALVPGIAPLETDRLILRAPMRHHFNAFADFLADPVLTSTLGGSENRATAWRAFLTGVGHWHWWGCGFWIITDKVTGQPLGRVGILRHDDWPEPELAWHLFAGAEGKSIAYEAALAARADAYDRVGLPPVISMIDKTNTRSIALATRMGAIAERDYLHDGVDCTLYRHPAQGDAA